MKVAVVSDNANLIKRLKALIEKKLFSAEFHFYGTATDPSRNEPGTTTINVKKEWEQLLQFDIVFSLHCKQLFPSTLVEAVKCINIHPGLNPYNRGWYPQVFSLINELPVGATIHEIDKELDHGGIIVQKKVEVETWDTSLTMYEKILDAEMQLLEDHLETILSGHYKSCPPGHEGNLNLKKDFQDLCEIDLKEASTYGDVLNRLRALSHGDYQNAWFKDPKTGKKVFVNISLTPEL